MTTPTIDLRGALDLPALGFGTYLVPDEEAAALVSTALDAGYRHIDTAEGYRNEAGVGQGLRAAMDAGLSRDELFVTTKLWPGNAEWGQTPKDAAATIAACEASLERLGLEHVDLYLIHAPFSPEDRLAQWRGLVELRARGLATAIGVSNFAEAHIDALVEAGLPLPDANQIELHPWSQKPALTAYLRDKGIGIIAYSSLVPLATWRAEPDEKSAKTKQMQADGERADRPFRRMAETYGVTEAQLLLRWGVQQGYAVIPKSTDPARIRANAELFGFAIDADDMAAIEGMDRGGGVAWSAGDPTTFG